MNPKDYSRVLQDAAREHLPAETNLLPGILARIEGEKRMKMKSTTRWITAALLLLAVLAVVLASLPETARAMRRLFGYIPGLGLVDQGAPIRVLAHPVHLTRQGITVSVNRATLTGDKTVLDTGVSGVPLSAYPKNESVSGCIEAEYLRLPDGSTQDLQAPIPANVDHAIYVMPCIFNTLPGMVPTDWELPLSFVPAPPDLTVMPVIEPTQTLPPTATPQAAAPVMPEANGTPAKTQPVAITIEKVVQTTDGYILIGALRIQDKSVSGLQQKGALVLRDAAGKKVAYTHPQELNGQLDWSDQNIKPFAIQFQAGGVSFPLTIEIPGTILSVPEPQATAEFVFDAGDNPQPGQEWKLNQEFQLAGHNLKLVSVTVQSRDNYSFVLGVAQDIDSVGVEIKGYTAVGAGGGGYYQGQIRTSVSFAELPKGKLTLVFSHLVVAGESQFWQARWQPDGMAPNWPTATPAAHPVCLNADSISRLQTLPAGLDGRVLLTEMNPDLRLVIARLDGSQRQELPLQSSRGVFSPDGQVIAYPTDGGIALLNLAANQATLLRGSSGYDLHWSPDGSQLAYVTNGEVNGIFVSPVDGSSGPRQLSNLGYESVAGWSPDGTQLYYAIPGSTGAGFLLKAVNASTGKTRELFTLDNSSRKAPLPEVSSDGKWVAYRASDNSSLYLKAMDGQSPARLLVDNPTPGSAISGITWGPAGGLLGFGLLTSDDPAGQVILLQPEGCEAYRLPGLQGELDGLLIP